MPERLRFRVTDQLFGGAVENGDGPCPVHADDAGAGGRQHRLDEAAAAVDQVAGVDEIVALRPQFLRHLVEGLAELREVALRAQHRHLDMKVAGGDQIRGSHQAADRSHQPVGEIQPDQHRRHQDGQRDHREHQGERNLDAEPARFELGVFLHAGLRLFQLSHDARVEQSRHIEESVLKRLEADHRRDVILLDEDADLRLVFVDIAEKVRRRGLEILPDSSRRGFEDVAVLVDDHRARQVARRRVRREQSAEALAVLIEQRPRPRNVVGHADDVAADQLGMLVDISIGHDQRVLDHRAGAHREQAIEAAVDGDVGDDRHQDGRQHRDDGKQADDLDVKPRGGPAAPTGLDHLPHFAGDDPQQHQHGGAVDEKERDDDLVGRLDRRQAREHHEGQERRQQGETDRERSQKAAQRPAGRLGKRRVERLGRRLCGGHARIMSGRICGIGGCCRIH